MCLCELEPEAGKHVACMVRANHSLTKLDLDGNYELGKKGIQKQKAICDALKATETAPCRIVCGVPETGRGVAVPRQ